MLSSDERLTASRYFFEKNLLFLKQNTFMPCCRYEGVLLYIQLSM